MKVNVSYLEVGEHFTTERGETFQITSREDYPFVYAKCVTQPNEYEGLEVAFCYEMVEVDKNAKVYKPEFIEKPKNHFQLILKKQW